MKKFLLMALALAAAVFAPAAPAAAQSATFNATGNFLSPPGAQFNITVTRINGLQYEVIAKGLPGNPPNTAPPGIRALTIGFFTSANAAPGTISNASVTTAGATELSTDAGFTNTVWSGGNFMGAAQFNAPAGAGAPQAQRISSYGLNQFRGTVTFGSVAEANAVGSVSIGLLDGSQTFEGFGALVPEPASMVVALSGLLPIAGAFLRKGRRRKSNVLEEATSETT